MRITEGEKERGIYKRERERKKARDNRFQIHGRATERVRETKR